MTWLLTGTLGTMAFRLPFGNYNPFVKEIFCSIVIYFTESEQNSRLKMESLLQI